MKRWLLGIVLLVLGIAGTVRAQAGPYLDNPGVKEPYTMRGAPEVMIPHGWLDPAVKQNTRRPEFKPDYPDGDIALHWFVRFDNMDAGVGAPIKNAQPGKLVRAWIDVYPWSSQLHDSKKCQNEKGGLVNYGKLHAMICVNPWGADVHHYATVCGMEALECARWNRVEVISPIYSENATVWLYTLTEFKASHQDVWWRNAGIEEVTLGSAICPTPEPGGTVDYNRIREIVEEVVRNREPVYWPSP